MAASAQKCDRDAGGATGERASRATFVANPSGFRAACASRRCMCVPGGAVCDSGRREERCERRRCRRWRCDDDERGEPAGKHALPYDFCAYRLVLFSLLSPQNSHASCRFVAAVEARPTDGGSSEACCSSSKASLCQSQCCWGLGPLGKLIARHNTVRPVGSSTVVSEGCRCSELDLLLADLYLAALGVRSQLVSHQSRMHASARACARALARGVTGGLSVTPRTRQSVRGSSR